MIRLLPRVAIATGFVAVMPLLAVWGFRSSGLVSSPVLAAALGAMLSLVVYHLAADRWQRRTDAADVLFGDLMPWGWARRGLQQRRIADAAALLGSGRGRAGRHRTALDPMQLSRARRVQLLERLAADLEARDAYTLGHSRRVARYSGLIAKRMGVPKAELTRIRTAAAVHDVGKLQTPLGVLRKPGALTVAEFGLIKRHPVDGARMVAILEDEDLTEIVLRHHERLDGSGYPGNLRGADVSLGARIVAVADTFDAITSARSYRSAKPHKQALDILRTEAGIKLDADAVEAFLSAYLGRRPFGAWIALTGFGERMLTWLTPGAVGSGTRLAAIAAGTVAVGSGALALHGTTGGPVRSSSSRPVTRHHVSALPGGVAARARQSVLGAATTGSANRAGAGGRSGAGTGLRFTAAAGQRGGVASRGKTGGRSSGPAWTGTTAAGGSTRTSGTGSSRGTSGAGTASGRNGASGGLGRLSGSPSSSDTSAPTVSVGVGAGSGNPGAGSGAPAGQSPGLPSVGVTVTPGAAGGAGGGSSNPVGATVSVGPVSAGVSATPPGGNGPAGVGLAIGGLGKGPPIKLG